MTFSSSSMRILCVETAILGGGITGATLFNVASRRGKDVVLLEAEDFASGTSQASGMMVWGGILYLKNFEFKLVQKLCRARDFLLAYAPEQIRVRWFQFLPLTRGGRSRWFVRMGLEVYRALSGFRRGPVHTAAKTDSPGQWKPRRFLPGLCYEEGFLRDSDALFTLNWLRSSGAFDKALNYQQIESIEWKKDQQRFLIQVLDKCTGERWGVLASKVVNCAGPWADSVNHRWGMSTKHRHHLSKGVYLVLRSGERDQAFVMDMEHEGDTLCWTPWGPVALWGPTETNATGPEDRHVDPADVEFLLERLRRNSGRDWSTKDILNVRVGIRPLAMPAGTEVGYSLELSRQFIFERSPSVPWWTTFGGKLSGCVSVALELHREIHNESLTPDQISPLEHTPRPMVDHLFGGLVVVDPAWSRDHESCRTLDDFLRRRTNVAQWVANSGLGEGDEFLTDIRSIADVLHKGDQIRVENDLKNYIQKQREQKMRWSHVC